MAFPPVPPPQDKGEPVTFDRFISGSGPPDRSDAIIRFCTCREGSIVERIILRTFSKAFLWRLMRLDPDDQLAILRGMIKEIQESPNGVIRFSFEDKGATAAIAQQTNGDASTITLVVSSF
jgi:hypothetical protein